MEMTVELVEGGFLGTETLGDGFECGIGEGIPGDADGEGGEKGEETRRHGCGWWGVGRREGSG